jgi:ribose transport system substrate-binding protein
VNRTKIVVYLINDKNEYQKEQGAAAEEAARKLGVDVTIIESGNDAINQSQQLLNIIQSRDSRPDGIVCLPVGTGLAQVAAAAARAGIGWAVLNRNADYLPDLRRSYKTPVFAVNIDMEEVGRIQGRQMAALLPRGGLALYIMGPATNPGSHVRANGMLSTKPANVSVRTLSGCWTEESGYKAVMSWLRLSTSHQTSVDLVCAQNDNMAMGARRAFQENTSGAEREHWSRLPYTGCDACAGEGQEWVHKSMMAASVKVPGSSALALEMLVSALRNGSQPPERTVLTPTSYPDIEKLAPSQSQRSLG